MALTVTQRELALTTLLQSAFTGGPLPLATVLPGIAISDIVNALVGAFGASFDTQLQTVINNVVAGETATAQAANAIITQYGGQPV